MQPTLVSEHLELRPFRLEDAGRVQQLASDYQVSQYMLQVPYPYLDGMAEQWIGSHSTDFESKTGMHFAIVLKSTSELIGAISLAVHAEHRRAGMGYWLGKDYWGQGHAVEACTTVIAYGFDQLNLNRIAADHFSVNPASGRVMQKVGMKHEGLLRQHYRKNGQYFDGEVYCILVDEYRAAQES